MNVDYWGDLLLAHEFVGTVNTDFSELDSSGEKDLLVTLCDAANGEMLWEKHIGGVGDELIHIFETNSYGSPLLVFQSVEGLIADDLSFSATNENEYHLTRLSPRTGDPEVNLDKLEFNDLGKFSFPLTAIHPEYLFFNIESGPPWISLVEDDPLNGSALLVGDSSKLTTEIEETNQLILSVFSMDGGYQEKNLPILFSESDQFKELGLYPQPSFILPTN